MNEFSKKVIKILKTRSDSKGELKISELLECGHEIEVNLLNNQKTAQKRICKYCYHNSKVVEFYDFKHCKLSGMLQRNYF